MSDELTTMNISLPESMRRFVRERMEAAGFANASEYLRHLIREDEKAAARQRLEGLLREGLESGPPRSMTEGDWADLRRRVRDGADTRKRKPA